MAGPDGDDGGVLVDRTAHAHHGTSQASHQAGRVQGGAVRGIGRSQQALDAQGLARLRRPQPAQVLFAETERPGLRYLVGGPGHLGPVAGSHERPRFGEAAVDAFSRSHPAHFVHAGLHGPAHGSGGVGAVVASDAGVGGREQGGTPSPVAPRGPKPRHLLLQHGDAGARGRLQDVVRRPQSRKTGAYHGHVDVDVGPERRPGVDGTGQAVPPQGQGPEALLSGPAELPGAELPGAELVGAERPGAAQIRCQASDRTRRRTSTIKSISAWPQMRGGDSCTTGSPRSSARQMRPASNRAPDR